MKAIIEGMLIRQPKYNDMVEQEFLEIIKFINICETPKSLKSILYGKLAYFSTTFGLAGMGY